MSGLFSGMRHQLLIAAETEEIALHLAAMKYPALHPASSSLAEPYCRQLRECGDGPVYVLDELALDIIEHIGGEWAVSGQERDAENDAALGRRLKADADSEGES